MIFGSCSIKNQFTFLSCLACISFLSVGLFYHLITRKENVLIRRYYGFSREFRFNIDDIEPNRSVPDWNPTVPDWNPTVPDWNPTVPDCVFSVAVWTENICPKTFENLEWLPKFPNFPDERYCTTNFSSFVRTGVYHTTVIKRILVLFSSLEPGLYQFRARSSLSLKIYLHTSHRSPSRNLVLVSSGTNFFTVFSKYSFLNKNSYLEIFTYYTPGDSFLALDWLVPGSTRFVSIFSRDLLPVHVTPYQNPPREVLPPDRSTLVSFITRSHVTKGFHVCGSYDIQKWSDSPASRNIFVYTESSPFDKFIHDILKLIMASLQNVAPSKYPGYKINKLELAQSSTPTQASRLLVDLDLTVDGLDYIERFNEYLWAYYYENQLEFCRPPCYQWDREVTLSFVFLSDCSRNDHPWGLYFIENIIELLQRSLEVNFRLLMTACDKEQRRSYEARLRISDIDRNEVVLLEGVDKRSHAMKAVLSLVENDSIVVLCESRVKMPAGIAEEIRKHTFKTIMAYSPTPYQLDCGYCPEGAEVKGNWCPECDGVTAIYKKDWAQLLSSQDDNEDILQNKIELSEHIEKAGIELVQVKLKDLYRL